MSIDRVNISNRGIDASQGLQGADSTRNTAKGRSVGSAAADGVEISSKAKDIERLSNAIEEARTERFNRIREALEAGTYHVSGSDIARKLIDANTK